jgi:hypothetical protein
MRAYVVAIVFTLASIAASHGREYNYKAIVCNAADGGTLRVETDVARDSGGRPATDDEGFARIVMGPLSAEGVFDRDGDYYNFRFSNVTLTIDRNGGTGFLYTSPTDPKKVAVLCRPAPNF